jgi:hypothetical protein
MPSNDVACSKFGFTILRLMAGSHVAHVVRAAAEPGLADHSNDQPADGQLLARANGTHAASLSQLLRALAAIELVQEMPDRPYKVTALGAALRTDFLARCDLLCSFFWTRSMSGRGKPFRTRFVLIRLPLAGRLAPINLSSCPLIQKARTCLTAPSVIGRRRSAVR